MEEVRRKEAVQDQGKRVQDSAPGRYEEKPINGIAVMYFQAAILLYVKVPD